MKRDKHEETRPLHLLELTLGTLPHLTELPLPSVVFGLDIWGCDQLLLYLRSFGQHFFHSLHYFVLDFYKQVQLVFFSVYQPFQLLSNLYHPMGVFRS